MKSYLPSKSGILGVASTDVESLTEQISLTAAATATGTDSTTELIKQLFDRMDKMEVELCQSKQAHLTAEGRGSHKRVNPNYRRKPPSFAGTVINQAMLLETAVSTHPSQTFTQIEPSVRKL